VLSTCVPLMLLHDHLVTDTLSKDDYPTLDPPWSTRTLYAFRVRFSRVQKHQLVHVPPVGGKHFPFVWALSKVHADKVRHCTRTATIWVESDDLRGETVMSAHGSQAARRSDYGCTSVSGDMYRFCIAVLMVSIPLMSELKG
jgi:hypothetical protein